MSPRFMGKKGKSDRKPKRSNFNRRKVCKYCADNKLTIDYKDGRVLMAFTTERGKIIPRRISGACARHQRAICTAIKRARVLALIPFSSTQVMMG